MMMMMLPIFNLRRGICTSVLQQEALCYNPSIISADLLQHIQRVCCKTTAVDIAYQQVRSGISSELFFCKPRYHIDRKRVQCVPKNIRFFVDQFCTVHKSYSQSTHTHAVARAIEALHAAWKPEFRRNIILHLTAEVFVCFSQYTCVLCDGLSQRTSCENKQINCELSLKVEAIIKLYI